MTKKSQMEMMGLALIVILISIAMLFVIRFVVLEKPVEHKKEFTQTELASNFVSTLLKTTNPTCRDLTFTEILQDVAEGWPAGPFTSCDEGYGRTNNALDNNVTLILNETLESWNIAYELTAVTDQVPPNTIYKRSGCPGAKKSKQFAIPIDAGGATTLYVKLDICS